MSTPRPSPGLRGARPADAKGGASLAADACARLVAVAAPVGLAAVGSDGIPVFANTALARLLGYDDPDELLRTPLRRFHAHPDSAVEVLMERAGEGSIEGVEMDLLRRDGSAVHVRINVRLLPVPDGSFLFVGSIEDVTQPREAQAAHAHTQKMEAVARFAAGVAHDYNNLLTTILGESTQVLSEVSEDEVAKEGIVRVMHAARRATHLTQRLLVFAKSEVVRTEVIRLDEAIRALRPSVEEMLPDDVQVVWRSEGADDAIRIAPRHLEHIVANLVANARDAMPAGGTIVVETGHVSAPADTEGIEFHPSIPPGEYASLAIGDRGIGMSGDTRLRMFDPFFTTKPIGQGSGLGLTIVYAMVQRAHGHISVMSAPAYGTVARILLPRRSASETSQIRVERRLSPAKGREQTATVLVVDDDHAVRDVMVRFLRRAAFEVLAAEGAQEALDIVRTAPSPIDVLVTDVMMPRMKGTDLAERVLALRPETRILLVSGYMDSARIQDWVESDADVFLAKPFEPAELVARVRRRLGWS